MKKLVNSGLKGYVTVWILIWVFQATLIPTAIQAQQGCVMSCPPMFPPVEIPLPASCTDELTYQEIGVTIDNCFGEIIVEIIVNGVPSGNVVTYDMVGQTFMVIITDSESQQSCMTNITVVDQQAPIVLCPEDVNLG